MTENLPVRAGEVDPDEVVKRAIVIDQWGGSIRPGATLQQIGMAILALLWMHERVPYIIGDILNEAEKMYGEVFAQIADVTGYAPGTLRNFAYIASRVKGKQRAQAEGTGISIQYEIAKFKEPEKQEYWINRIKKENLTREEVRDKMATEEQEEYRHEKQVRDVVWVACPTCGSTVTRSSLEEYE